MAADSPTPVNPPLWVLGDLPDGLPCQAWTVDRPVISLNGPDPLVTATTAHAVHAAARSCAAVRALGLDPDPDLPVDHWCFDDSHPHDIGVWFDQLAELIDSRLHLLRSRGHTDWPGNWPGVLVVANRLGWHVNRASDPHLALRAVESLAAHAPNVGVVALVTNVGASDEAGEDTAVSLLSPVTTAVTVADMGLVHVGPDRVPVRQSLRV